MGNNGIGIGGWALAGMLAAIGIWIGCLCLRVAAVQEEDWATLNGEDPNASALNQFVPDYPKAAFARANAAIAKKIAVDVKTLAAVRQAALSEPLDAWPFLIFGYQQLLDGRVERAGATLEAGQRLDPRQPIIHAFLLGQYNLMGRYGDAIVQLSVIARLSGQMRAQVVTALTQLSRVPVIQEAVRHTLKSDPKLEREVLGALIKNETPPDAIFAFASQAARASAGERQGWGSLLVDHLVEQRKYGLARGVWRRVYGIRDTASGIFNSSFRVLPATPPFNWHFTTESLGSAGMKNGALAVEYYGRDSGTLTSQLVVLPPGRYRFSVTIDPGKTDTGSRLIWSLGCRPNQSALLDLAVVASPSPHWIGADFVVPTDCPAQELSLRGEAGEFPAPTDITMRRPDIRVLSGQIR